MSDTVATPAPAPAPAPAAKPKNVKSVIDAAAGTVTLTTGADAPVSFTISKLPAPVRSHLELVGLRFMLVNGADFSKLEAGEIGARKNAAKKPVVLNIWKEAAAHFRAEQVAKAAGIKLGRAKLVQAPEFLTALAAARVVVGDWDLGRLNEAKKASAIVEWHEHLTGGPVAVDKLFEPPVPTPVGPVLAAPGADMAEAAD